MYADWENADHKLASRFRNRYYCLCLLRHIVSLFQGITGSVIKRYMYNTWLKSFFPRSTTERNYTEYYSQKSRTKKRVYVWLDSTPSPAKMRHYATCPRCGRILVPTSPHRKCASFDNQVLQSHCYVCTSSRMCIYAGRKYVGVVWAVLLPLILVSTFHTSLK